MPKQIGSPTAIQKAMKALDAKGVHVEPRKPDEFTCQEYALERGINRKTAWEHLEKMVNEKVLTKRRGYNSQNFYEVVK